MRVRAVSVDALLISFGKEIDPHILGMVRSAYSILKECEEVRNITPSYSTILVEYDLRRYSHEDMTSLIERKLAEVQVNSAEPQGRHFRIPARYDRDAGWDIERVALYNGLSIEEVIELHSSMIYRVYAIGFMAGFGYLARNDPRIATPRLETPRTKVPKGSIAIANEQSAIYPGDSAGGWNIIARTSWDSFDELRVGDSVEFVRVG